MAIRKRFLGALLGMAVLCSAGPARTQDDVSAIEGSTRKVRTCNVDGTYTCLNEDCRGVGCCQSGG